MQPWNPEYLILHDYGGTPGANPSFNPYHALVSGGGISYRNPNDPYSAPAPHAYKLNPKSIGLSWGGKVGGMPSKDEFALLKKEYDAIRKRFPGIKVLSHGEAYQQTRGTGQQASKAGRGLEEAAWRKYLLGDMPYEPGTVTPSGPVPMSQRSLTAVAGHTQTQPPTTGAPKNMATYKDVGGQTYMGPQAAASSQRLAQSLMQQGLNPGPMRHWTEALGSVLMSGVGGLRNDMAVRDMEQGQQSGNAALAAMLQGNDPNAQAAALKNPYSQQNAMDWLQEQKKAELKAQQEAGYGKSGSVFQDPATGTFYTIQFGNDGSRKILPVETGGTPLTPSKGTTVIGDTLRDSATGRVIENVAPAIAGGEIAKGEGQNVAKVRAELPGEKSRLSLVTAQLDRLDQAASSVENQPGLDKVVGGLYQTYALDVTEPARNAGTALENLKVQISGQVLQAMREMSKTGGAVGQVTEREWPRLENMLANLDPRQGKEQFLQNLKIVRDYTKKVKDELRAAYEADVATAQGGGSAPGSMAPVEVQQPSERVWNPTTGRLE